MKKLLLLFFAFCMLTFDFAQAQIPSYVPTNGLVGYWPFNGNANDESGNGNNGTVNGATLTTDRFGNSGKAYSFNGSNSFISTNFNPPSGSNSRSVSTWIKWKSLVNICDADMVVLSYGSNSSSCSQSGGNFGLVINYYMSSSPHFDIDGNCTVKYQDYSQSTLDSNWHFLTAVFDNSFGNEFKNIKLYLDAQMVPMSDYNGETILNTLLLSPLTIGRGSNECKRYFSGKIDDIAIYNRALTQEEITALYSGTPPCAATTSTTNLTITSTSLPYTWNGLTFNAAGSQTAHLTNSCGADSAATLNLAVTNTMPSYLPTNGLVGYWPFNGNANDESGNGRNGTNNGATLTIDRFGNTNRAYAFDGSGNHISASCDGFSTGERTLSFWFYGNDIGVGQSGRTIMGYGGNGSCGTSCLVVIDNAALGGNRYEISGHCQNENVDYYYGPNHPNDQWIHWVITTSQNGTYFYLNGNQVKYSSTFIHQTFTSARKIFFGISTFWDGVSPYSDVNVMPFNGSLDDIAIYNRALTQQEITALYRNCTSADSSSFAAQACELYNLPWGDTVTTSGTYTHTYSNASGCDSIITANITIHHPEAGASQNVSGTNFYVLPWSDTVRASGYYTHTYQNQYGCDSLVTYYVVINQPSSSSSPNVGINIINPQRSLHVKDIIRLEPRNSAPENPTKGDMYFDGTTDKLRIFDGRVWRDAY